MRNKRGEYESIDSMDSDEAAQYQYHNSTSSKIN